MEYDIANAKGSNNSEINMNLSIYFFLLLVTVLSMDAFAAGLSYGVEKVWVPFSSLSIIALLSGGMLTASLFAGNLLLSLIPDRLTKILSFLVLFLLFSFGFLLVLEDGVKQDSHLFCAAPCQPHRDLTGLQTQPNDLFRRVFFL